MIIAQTTAVHPEFLIQLILALGLLGNLALTFINLVGQKRAQKREVTFTEEMVPRSICKVLHANLDQRLAGIEHSIEDLRKELRDENGKIHNRIDQILAAVSEMRGELNQ